ncbi:ABC transporter substrate-binding protein [Sneathiella chinensis]|uniref:ABC transporter substrate-binding protein n=1 Tax=Sneathiella chinensis TaxID=349750 RepID=A0ABQ5TYU9_9PROT|nr:ABC transporter substrate-binding protein [Sneathiella chinensis]
MNIAVDGEIATLDYYMSSGRSAIIMSHHIFDTLIYKDTQSGEFVPALAESFEFENETTLKFVMRDGVKFHDGSDLTAEDVVYTINKVTDPAYGAVYQTAIKWIEKAEQRDDRTVIIKLKKAYPAALEWVAGFLPIYPSDYYEKAGKEGMALAPVGSGPYKVEAVEAGNRWKLKRFEEHYQGSPKQASIGSLDMRVYPEVNTQLTGLMTGNIDFMWKFSSDVAERLEATGKVRLGNEPIMRIVFLALDATEEGPVKNVKVRQAINHAINRDAIRASLFGGATQLIPTACNPVQFGCSTNVKTYEYDVEKAKSLLADAGYKNGFELDLLQVKSGSVPRAFAEAIISDLAKVGVKVNIEVQPWAASRDKWSGGDGDALLMSWGSWGIADTAMITSYWFGGGKINRAGDSDVTEHLLLADNSIDRKERQASYEIALQRIADQAYWVPLWTYSVNYATNPDLNLKVDSDEIVRFFNASWK